MNFTKENVEYHWKVLNSAGSQEDKKTADEFLIHFKKSPEALDICIQLFDSKDVGSHFLSAIVLHQILKERINDVIERKEEFCKFRHMILNNLLEKMKSSPSYIIERICFSISILVAVGIITYWPEGIEEIISFAKSAKENCYLALIILENINKEMFELHISTKTLMRIKDILIDRKQLIQEFIFLVLTNVNQANLPEQEMKINNQIFNKTLELTYSWIKLGLNVLKIPLLSQTLITYLSPDNIKKIAEIFSESIQFSSNSKYYSVNELYDLDQILEKYDKEELQSIENLVEMIKNSLINLSSKKMNPEELEILNGLANIFSSVLENFINLLFLKNSLSQTLLEIFFFFISHQNRKISLKFFESMNEMREFINRGYKFYNYTDEEKLAFVNFLFKISESVMFNSKLHKLSINTNLIQKKEVFSPEELESLHEADANSSDDLEEGGVSLSEYRRSAEDVFYNIFLIFTYNFGEEGAEFFFKWVMNLLNGLDITNDSIANDEGRLLVVEVLIKVVKSVLDSIDINQMNHKYILNFCSVILNSKVMMNDCMMMKFLQFLDDASLFICRDKNMMTSIVNFLINVAKIKFLENISTYILLQITDFLTEPDVDIFRTVFEFYQNNYDNFAFSSLTNVCDALTNLVGVLNRDLKVTVGLTSEDIVNYFSYILQPATERIHKAYMLLENQSNLIENDYNKFKMEFLKNYAVHNSVLKKSFFLTEKILYGVFEIHMKDVSEITEKIFKLFVKDCHMIREISKCYLKPLHHLSSSIVHYFDKFNEMIVNAYLNNYENYSCLSLLKVLYSDTVQNSPEKKDYISQHFFSLCEVINKNVYSMKKNQIELVDIYSQLFLKVVDTVDYLVINPEVLENSIDLFLDVIKTVAEPGMNKNVMRLLARFLSCSKVIPKEYIYNKFAQIVYAVFFSCDHFEHTAMPDFAHFAIAAVEYDPNIFSSTLYSTFSQVKFKAFKKENVDVIVRYLTTMGKEVQSVKVLLSDVTNIVKGMGQTEALLQFEMALAREDRKQKLAMSN